MHKTGSMQTQVITLATLSCVSVTFRTLQLLGEGKNGTDKSFGALKISNNCQQTFRNNFER